MNCDTGHLKSFPADYPISIGFTRLPEDLEPAARTVLAGRDEAQVSLTSGGKLSKWAAKERKNRRKQTRASQRRNRN